VWTLLFHIHILDFDIFSLNFQKHANVSSKECCTSIDKSFADDEIDKSSPDQVNNLGGDGAFANVASEAYMKSMLYCKCRCIDLF
jgi:hypothetical protein